ARLVTRRREGKEHRIAFAPEPLEELARWITEKRAFWNPRLDRLQALLEKDDTP
ncbi:MAG TPA: transcriptional regulator, partial [Alphaproteobacteria bacterium]|nr:transcriptional regulator [Alphaproteobacteria bacterium]